MTLENRPVLADPAFRWEDVVVGERHRSGPYTLSEDEIIAFARRYDPLPIHLDPAAAAASPFGGLTASGSQMLSVRQRLLYDFAFSGGVIVSLGFEEVRYAAPLRAGRRCVVEIEFLAKRPSNSQPERGIVTIGTTLLAEDEAVLTLRENVLMRRRL